MATLLHALLYWVLSTFFAAVQACMRAMDILHHWSWQRDTVPHVDGFDVPQHLAVVFSLPTQTQNDTDVASLHAAADDVLRLVQWSALAGIAELTVYDKDGLLARVVADRLRRKSNVHGWATMQVHLGQAMVEPKRLVCPVPPPSIRGPPRQSHVQVNLLSAADDKPALLNAFQNTGTWVPHAVSHTLYESGPMTCEPSILMVCGDTMPVPRLHGFPAWSLRITTVGSLPSWAFLRRWTPDHFLDTLRLYTATEQRHGA